ncbi:MAG: hypothetical protein RR375_00945 [Bacilli bacterium]
MIVRRPYAFLIRYFKVIHIILSVFMGYMIYKSTNILMFFNSYAKNGYFTFYDNLKSHFLGTLFIISIIVTIVISLVLYIVMRQKNKKRMYYSFIIMFSFLLIILLFYTSGILGKLINISLSVKTIRGLRDMWVIAVLLEYALIIFSIIRAIGFNIKSFNFEKDLEDLKISQKDNEEIELVIKDDNYKYLRYARKYLKEFKYYFIENKRMFILISVVCVLAICGGIYYNYKKTDVNGSYASSYVTSNVRYNIKNSYITTLDYKGQIINKNKKYIVVTFDAENMSNSKTSLRIENFILKIGDKNYLSIKNKDLFKDIGSLYINQVLQPFNKYEYIIAFELDLKSPTTDALLLYSYTTTNNDESKIKYYKNKLLLKYADKISIKDVEFGKDIILDNKTFAINSYDVNSSYEESFKSIINNKEIINKIVIKPGINEIDNYNVLRINIKHDNLNSNYFYKLINDYGFITYQNKKYKLKVLNDLVNNNIYCIVPKNIDDYNLMFTIRNNNLKIVNKKVQ